MEDEQTPGAGDGTPPIFKNINGWIAGATSVVAALGGLYLTYDKLLGGPRAEAAASTAGAAGSAGTAKAPADEAEAPSSYAADNGGSLDFKDGMWIETDADGNVSKFEQVSDDGDTIVAKLPGGGENGEDIYLRWHNAGGEVEQSLDRQDTWADRYKVTPATDEAPAEATPAT